jgi:ubiquinone/menaquinone biosynthesis C-methylase UbiE
MTNYLDVTELAGDPVSLEQIERVCRRYAWALTFAHGRDVLEVACGTGPGLGLLQSKSRSLMAGDISEEILSCARRHYGSRINLQKIDAMNLPLADNSIDLIVIFEAMYYLSDPQRFVAECARVLRPGGIVLVSNANKDLFDFNPSPYSYIYHGVIELDKLFSSFNFECHFWGDVSVSQLSLRQKIVRPIKSAVVSLGLMPRSMAGKKLLKRLVFGHMQPFPAEIANSQLPNQLNFSSLPNDKPDREHKVILCAATLKEQIYDTTKVI